MPIKAIKRDDVEWTAWELRRKGRSHLLRLVPQRRVYFGDFLAARRRGELRGQRFNVAFTNPPFSRADEFIEACLDHADIVVMLQRINVLGAEGRWELMRSNTPSIYVLPNRPAFLVKKVKGKRGTSLRWAADSSEYAWFVWDRARRGAARVRILDLTDKKVRLPRLGRPRHRKRASRPPRRRHLAR